LLIFIVKDIIKDLLIAYKGMSCNMSIKIFRIYYFSLLI